MCVFKAEFKELTPVVKVKTVRLSRSSIGTLTIDAFLLSGSKGPSKDKGGKDEY